MANTTTLHGAIRIEDEADFIGFESYTEAQKFCERHEEYRPMTTSTGHDLASALAIWGETP